MYMMTNISLKILNEKRYKIKAYLYVNLDLKLDKIKKHTERRRSHENKD